MPRNKQKSWFLYPNADPDKAIADSLQGMSDQPFLPTPVPSLHFPQSKRLIHFLFFPFLLPSFPSLLILESLSSSDNTARILTRRSGFRQQEQSIFYLPILISDNGQPVLSSTGTLTIQVCSCDDNGHVLSCSPEAYLLPVTLSRGALIAILGCIFVLLGE